MGLLSGLGDLGLEKLEGASIYEEKKEEVKPKAQAQAQEEKPFDENEWLFDKTCECVVCRSKFTYRAVRTGKARMIGQDPDLRPIYDKMDPIKYDVIVCPSCGYSALIRYFTGITAGQAKLVKTAIAGKVHGIKNSGIFSYDDAIKRYQLALACAITKKGKNSERAYTCLKMAWCYRGKRDTYPVDAADYDEAVKECRENENEALKLTYEGLIKARQEENFPIAGMDEHTLDYLIADLAVRFNDLDTASKLVGKLLTSQSANERIKNKARTLKEMIQFEKNNQ